MATNSRRIWRELALHKKTCLHKKSEFWGMA